MKLARFRNTTGTSLASARTRPAISGAPALRSVRRERFVAERSASDVYNEGMSEARANTAIADALGNAVVGYAKKIEDAEFKAQAAKALNVYQKEVAELRADQINQPITQVNAAGEREIVSNGFNDDYQEMSSAIAAGIVDGGLTNQRAKEFFELKRGEIDNKHLQDIHKHNLDARVEVAKADSMQALDSAVTKGQISEIVNDMANNRLIEFSAAPALAKKHIQKLNTRKAMQSLTIINDSAGNTNIGDSEFADQVSASFDFAYEQLQNDEISPAQFNQIGAMVKQVEANREGKVEMQREYNTFKFIAGMAQQSATSGQSVSQMSRDILRSPQAINQIVSSVGPDKAVGLIKTMNEAAKGGDPDTFAQQQASSLVNRYRETGTPEAYNAAVSYFDQNAESLASSGISMRSQLTTARNNRQSDRMRSAMTVIDGVVASKRTQQDFLTGASGTDIQERNKWKARMTLLLDDENRPNPDGTMPEPVDLTGWFLNEKLGEVNVPDYGGESIVSFDRSKAMNHVNKTFQENQEDFEQMFTTSDGESVNIYDWKDREIQAIDEVMQFKGLLKQKSMIQRLDEDVREKLGIKMKVQNGVVTYE